MPHGERTDESVLIVAVATQGDRVAPTCVPCPEYTVAVLHRGRLWRAHRFSTWGCKEAEIPERLASLGVDMVVAGHIERGTRDELSLLGVHTMVGVSGPVEQVLAVWRRNPQIGVGDDHREQGPTPAGSRGEGFASPAKPGPEPSSGGQDVEAAAPRPPLAERLRSCQLRALRSLATPGNPRPHDMEGGTPTQDRHAPECPEMRGFRCVLTGGPCLPSWPADTRIPQPSWPGLSHGGEVRAATVGDSAEAAQARLALLEERAQALRRRIESVRSRIAKPWQ